jgi:hypothetical protein
MYEIIVLVSIFAVFLIGALLLYFIKFIIGRIEKRFMSREESLVVFGLALMIVGLFFSPLGMGGNPFGVSLLWMGIGILFADWILNWERIVERYRPKKES